MMSYDTNPEGRARSIIMSQDIDTGKHNTLPTLRYDSDMFLEKSRKTKLST